MIWDKYLRKIVLNSDMGHHNRRDYDDRVEIRAVVGDAESVIHTILRGVAAIKNVPISELKPLYEQIETDALGDLLAHARERNAIATVEFTVDEYTVVVSQNDRVRIHDGDPTVI